MYEPYHENIMNLRPLPILAALTLAACGGGDSVPSPQLPKPPTTLFCGPAKTLEFRLVAFDANWLGRIGHIDSLAAGTYQLSAEFYTASALNSEVYLQVVSSDGRVLEETLLPIELEGRVFFPGLVFTMDSDRHGVVVSVRLPKGGVVQDQTISIQTCTLKRAVL